MYFFHYRLLWSEVKVTQSCLTLCNPMDCTWNSPAQNTGVGSLSLLQRIFPTQGSNPGLLHWRRILYQLSHKGSPRILEWVAFPFSRGSSQPRDRTQASRIAGGSPRILEWVAYPFSNGSSWSRNQTQVSHIACDFFNLWATREAPLRWQYARVKNFLFENQNIRSSMLKTVPINKFHVADLIFVLVFLNDNQFILGD